MEVGTLLLSGAACAGGGGAAMEPVCAGCGPWPERPGSTDQ